MVRVDGKVHKMKFKVCTKIEMHNKFLVSKLDFLLKTCWPKNGHDYNSQRGNGGILFLEKK
jgi:hypothetical protein